MPFQRSTWYSVLADGKPRVVGIAAVLVSLLLAACAEQPRTEAERFYALGQQTYQLNCIQCHQADGQGIRGVYPPISQNAWVEGDKGRLIRLILHGMDGRMEIDGVTYNQRMQPFDRLTDEQIGAVLTFVRSNFGNEAEPVSPAEVSRVRDASDQESTWNPDTLWMRTGIPGGPDDAEELEKLQVDGAD